MPTGINSCPHACAGRVFAMTMPTMRSIKNIIISISYKFTIGQACPRLIQIYIK